MSASISITPIAAFHDNYLWLLSNSVGDALVVDPGDPKPVEAYLEAQGLTLKAILITHHHHDHIGGVEQLVNHYRVPVYGPDSAYIPQVTDPLGDGDKLAIFSEPEAIHFTVMAVPGHTQDHIAYFSTIDEQPVIFCGDTLFAAGCGRLFDGTHEQLRQSLERINQLPESTKIYCTHEYTMANLAFAHAVEPNNQAINQRINKEQHKRSQQQPTLPTQLRLEQQTNPFLRYQQTQVATAINNHWQQQWDSPSELFAGLRRWKDSF